MEKQMVQCEDGRRREARIHGNPREEGGFKIWKAGVRFKGKHVSGEAWYSFQTKAWYFITDPVGRHSHLMNRIRDTLKEERINKLREQLKVLESRHTIERRQMAEHRKAIEAIESEIETVKGSIAKLEKGIPLESDKPLAYSRTIRRS
ncbi:MAG: hypothetical protein JSW39_11910 [Desulfobacterales bacterium]|nr:MAG: hypothetical protein JSW39_11910 [Desulfobacterales bacterium]